MLQRVTGSVSRPALSRPALSRPALSGLAGVLLATVTLSAVACDSASEPPTAHFVVLSGTPYERGFAHGQRFSAHIRSLYTRLLESSIIPFLNREQVNIAPILQTYEQPEYQDGKFAYRLLLESGQHLYDHDIPDALKEELRGIADGAGVDLEKIIILNTFMDTMMAFRAVVLYIKHIQTPHIDVLEFVSGSVGGGSAAIGTDGVDNDRDGATDEEGEGRVTDYSPSPWALALEVPPGDGLRFVLRDQRLGGLACPDPRNVDPLGAVEMESRCVDPACVLPECAGAPLISRECLSERALTCLAPRVDVGCVDLTCLEIADPGCVDPDSVRIRMNEQVFEPPDGAIRTTRLPDDGDDIYEKEGMPEGLHTLRCQGPLEIVFAPPGGFPAASEIQLTILASDLSPIYSPEPFHHRVMREERLAFTTAGYAAAIGADAEGMALHDVPSRGVDDGSTQPPAIGFAVRGAATPSGAPLLAHHFALLDSNVVHEHGALFVHLPDAASGTRPVAFLGWTGLVYGVSGMNDAGLSVAFDYSDSLDNPLLGGMLEDILEPEHLLALLQKPNLEGLAEVLAERKLIATGVPAGMTLRGLLEETATTDEALARLHALRQTFGWNYLLADAGGAIAAVEVDAAVEASIDPAERAGTPPADHDGFQLFTPDATVEANLDRDGRRWASVGADDLRMASHFRKNDRDIRKNPIMGLFSPLPQRFWTGYYFRSVRAWHLLGDELAARHGRIDPDEAITILRVRALADQRDSMAAAVYEPARRVVRWAVGAVPASDLPFRTFDFAAFLAEVGR